MNPILLTSSLFCNILNVKDWKPLQLDFNVIGIGLQIPTTSVHPRRFFGLGWATGATYKGHYYTNSVHDNRVTSDVVIFGEHSLAFMYKPVSNITSSSPKLKIEDFMCAINSKHIIIR